MRLEGAAGRMRRTPGECDFSDLTDAVVSGNPSWDGNTLVLPFDPDPTPREQRMIARRLMTASDGQEAWVAELTARAVAVGRDPLVPTSVKQLLRVLAQGALSGIENLDMEA